MSKWERLGRVTVWQPIALNFTTCSEEREACAVVVLCVWRSLLVLGKDVEANQGYRMGLVCRVGGLVFAGSLWEGTLLLFEVTFVAVG